MSMEYTMIFSRKQKLQELTAEVAGIKAQLNGLGWRASDLGLSATASDLAEAQDKVHEAHRGLVALLEIAESGSRSKK